MRQSNSEPTSPERNGPPLAPEILALSLGHLQLNGYTHRFTARFRTIGSVRAALKRFGEVVPVGAKAASRELDLALGGLYQSILHGGKNWDAFRESRPRQARRGTIYFFSPLLDRLHPTIAGKSLASLHLSRRGVNALSAIGVKTIGNLIDRARQGIEHLAAAYALTSCEIIEALDSLSKSVKRNGDVDWIRYAIRRGFVIIPKRQRRRWPPRDFVRELSHAAELAVQIRYGRDDVLILRNRILQSTNRPPLRESGKVFGRTRQRIVVIQRRIIKMFREIFRDDEYQGCKFRLRPEFVQPLRSLTKMIRVGPDGAMSLSQWERQLMKSWGLQSHELGASERLILEVLGLQLLTAKKTISKKIERLFTWHYPEGLTPDRLHSILKKKLGRCAPTLRELPDFLRSISVLEKRLVCGRYRAQTLSLTRKSDQFERILRDADRPLRFRDIAGQIRGEQAASDRLYTRRVEALLSADDRFVPICRTGFWSLAEWGPLETRSIANIAADLLSRSKVPVHEEELFVLISQRRPVTKPSIGCVLQRDNRFRRMAPRTWELIKDL